MIEIEELDKCLSYLYGSDADFMVEGLRGKTSLSYDEVVEMRCEHRDYEYSVGSLLTSWGCAYCRRMVKTYRESCDAIEAIIRTHSGIIDEANNRHTLERRRAARASATKTLNETLEKRKAQGLPHYNVGNSHNLKYDTESFIKKAAEVHDGKYSYERAVYTTSYNRLVVTCPEHGDFEQNAANHLYGAGCPKCATHGFNPVKQAYLYILLDTETHSRVKIGISNVPDKRLAILKRKTPFTIERIDLFETIPEITLQIESLCHSQLDSANLTDFDGATEWFKFDGGKLEALRAFILSTGGVSVG